MIKVVTGQKLEKFPIVMQGKKVPNCSSKQEYPMKSSD